MSKIAILVQILKSPSQNELIPESGTVFLLMERTRSRSKSRSNSANADIIAARRTWAE